MTPEKTAHIYKIVQINQTVVRVETQLLLLKGTLYDQETNDKRV